MILRLPAFGRCDTLQNIEGSVTDREDRLYDACELKIHAGNALSEPENEERMEHIRKGENMALREELLTTIEKNSRIDVKELAIRLGVQEIDIINELQKCEEDGIICGYHTMINWDKVGIEKVSALIEVTVTPQRGEGFDKIAERIYKYPEVNSVYLISGGFDLLVSLEGKTLKEVSYFVSDKLSTLETVVSTATHFILKKYKDHGTILDKGYEDTREKVSP